MSRRSITMPDVGEGITEVEIVEWNVGVGDPVREDDILASVMTDKATVEIPSPVDGRVVALEGEVGEMTAVGTVIAVIETEQVGGEPGEENIEAKAKVSEKDEEQRTTDVAEKPVRPPVLHEFFRSGRESRRQNSAHPVKSG